jgi:hypothetical protein
MTTIILIAKEPIPGKVKTRLHPPLSYEQAADVAAAAIHDTIEVINALPASRRILLFDGKEYPHEIHGWYVVDQTEGGLDERLADIFDAVEGKTILIGMDTPQVTVGDLLPVFTEWDDSVDAWFGPANDGGFWALGMANPDGSLIRGVPMSQDDTGRIQLERLEAAGLKVRILPTLIDVDTFDEALAVAEIASDGEFAKVIQAAQA